LRRSPRITRSSRVGPDFDFSIVKLNGVCCNFNESAFVLGRFGVCVSLDDELA